MTTATAEVHRTREAVPAPFEARVDRVEHVASGVRRVVLARPGGGAFPAWTGGAHLRVGFGAAGATEYSLVPTGDERRIAIAVQRDPAGRGRSEHVHTRLRQGDLVTCEGFGRNTFPLAEAPALLFIAGGIGITPFLSLIADAQRREVPWRLVYLGRERAGMAFAAELLRAYPDRVTVWPSDEHGRIDLAGLVGDAAGADTGTVVACCGPAELIDATRQAASDNALGFACERFSADAAEHDDDRAFDVCAELSGVTVTVPAGESILGRLRQAGLGLPSSCEEGTCGTCEAVVLEGEPDHRDAVLSDAERDANETMMICVSRCRGDRLVLEL